MKQILTIVDEPNLASLLRQSFRQEGPEVIDISSGSEMLALLCRCTPSLIVLNAALPDIDGYEICKRVRALEKWPLVILMLSEQTDVADKVKGLESGADDYITKPFDLIELLARIRAGLRRVNAFTRQLQRLEVADLVIDTSARQVWRSGDPIELTKREYELLELLAKNAGQVLTKECIFDRVWGWGSQANWEVIKVYINYLRAKLNTGDKVDLIHAVRGVGYVLRSDGSRHCFNAFNEEMQVREKTYSLVAEGAYAEKIR